MRQAVPIDDVVTVRPLVGRHNRPLAWIPVLVVAGSAALLPLWIDIMHTWATDPLRSIGALFPAIALAGVLARWRQLDWVRQGSWWGLALVGASLPLARFVSVANLDLTVQGGSWNLLHGGPALFLYGAGATLLFGGPRLLRAALAPLCLLLAINPVPHAFNQMADLPLQELSARTARGFAHLIGLRPTGEQLRMMFAPNFGMMIVPGCNGVRGSITLAYLTLIFGYTRRLRPLRLAGVTLAALLLGYVLNLLRLCILVVYYRVGLSWTSIQRHGVGVDYAIGCTVFLLATVAVGLGVRALELPGGESIPLQRQEAKPFPAVRALCFTALILFFFVPELPLLASVSLRPPSEQEILRVFPQQVGSYRLARTYVESNGYGGISLGMAEYADAGTNRRLTLGLWLESAHHSVATSRLVQGLRASSVGAFDVTTHSGQEAHVVTSFYDDGVTRTADADATCSMTGCSDQLAGNGESRLRFIAPRLRDLALPPTGKRLPILLEREMPQDDPIAANEFRVQFEHDAQSFLQQIDLNPLVQQLGSQP